MEGESSSTKQFTFQEEMRGIFSNRMERLLSFEEDKDRQLWSEEEDEQQEQQQQEVEEGSKKKRRTTAGPGSSGGNTIVRVSNRDKAVANIEEVKKAMKDIMDWQIQMEAQWMEAAEAREAERRAAVEEWRRMMVVLAEQRAEMHRRWREREEERRLREEERAERRHQLFVAVLTKLTDQNM